MAAGHVSAHALLYRLIRTDRIIDWMEFRLGRDGRDGMPGPPGPAGNEQTFVEYPSILFFCGLFVCLHVHVFILTQL